MTYSGFLRPKPEIIPILLSFLLLGGLFTILISLKLSEISFSNLPNVLSVLQILPIFVVLSNGDITSNFNVSASASLAPPLIMSQFE